MAIRVIKEDCDTRGLVATAITGDSTRINGIYQLANENGEIHRRDGVIPFIEGQERTSPRTVQTSGGISQLNRVVAMRFLPNLRSFVAGRRCKAAATIIGLYLSTGGLIIYKHVTISCRCAKLIIRSYFI